MQASPLIYAHEIWLNSQLSIARFYGGMTINGHRFVILTPCNDLVRQDICEAYCYFGRDKTAQFIKDGADAKQINNIYRQAREYERKAKLAVAADASSPQQQMLPI